MDVIFILVEIKVPYSESIDSNFYEDYCVCAEGQVEGGVPCAKIYNCLYCL